MLLGAALFTAVAIPSAMAEKGLFDSFSEAELLSSQAFQQQTLKKSVSLDTVVYDADSDDEGDVVVARLSRQNSQEKFENSSNT